MDYPTEGAAFYARTGKSVRQQVLEDNPCENCNDILSLMAGRYTNTSGGRPSDGARYVVSLHARVGCQDFRRRYEEGAGSSRTLGEARGSLA